MTKSHGFEIRKITSGRAASANGAPVFGLRDTDKANTWRIVPVFKTRDAADSYAWHCWEFKTGRRSTFTLE